MRLRIHGKIPGMNAGTAPPTTAPPARTPLPAWLGRLSGRVLATAAVGLAVVLVLLGFFAARGLNLFPSWGNPLSERTVDRSERPLQLSLEDLSEYHAAVGTYQVVLDIERDRRFVPSLVSGERTIFLATGSVDGFVDFSAITPERVVVDQESRSATITLPAPRLAKPVLDLEASRVLSRNRGLVERLGSVLQENPGGETEFLQLAEQRLVESASQSDLRQRTEDNTRTMLTALGRSLGFATVTVTFEPAPQ